MQNIEIKNWRTGKIIISGKYESIKDCLEKNKNAYLEGAYLEDAYLRGADLENADLRNAYLEGAYLRGADLENADLKGANLRGADLENADLENADLRGANLRGADLRNADLGGAKNYHNSHEFFIQIIKNNMNKFTQQEQEICAYIFAYGLCWKKIKKQYEKEGLKIGKKLTKLGFKEFEEKFKKEAR